MKVEGFFEGRAPFVHVYFRGSSRPVKVLVDTGFSGHLMLQRDKIDRLSLPQVGEDFYVAAGGAEVDTTVHAASLNWFGETRQVPVLATDGKAALLGMELLFDRSLRMTPSEGVLRIE